MEKSPAWIGIDPSYSAFGMVCLIQHKAIPSTDHLGSLEFLEDFSPSRAGNSGARLAYIYRQLVSMFTILSGEHELKAVAVEGYANGARFHREALGELGGIVRLAAHDVLSDICGEILIVQPTALKKYATGKGTAQKSDMKLAVYKKWHVEFQSHDLADAYTVARVAHGYTEGTTLAYEKAVIDTMRSPKRDRVKKTV